MRTSICPKFKKGSPSAPANYRPIALTCSCCKIFESIISDAISSYLLAHNLISNHQHGFLKKHSTSTNLLETLNDWTISFSNRNSTIAGYIDFARAFDSVSHPKLIHKLLSYGIKGNLLLFIQDFLSSRFQSVKIGSSISSAVPVISGVPQGSILGPLLFNIYINDITDLFSNVTIKLYADDIKLYTILSYPSALSDFQNHLDIISTWSTTWQIEISYSKCSTITLGLPTPTPTFHLGTNSLPHSVVVKDLGLLIDPTLKFNLHILDLTKRARQRSSLIFRSFLSRDPIILLRAFKTYIRPLLEYSSTVWNPSTIHLIDKLESVQRSFTKRLNGLSHLPYSARLSNTKLQSLELRRLIIDLITCFNIVKGFSSIPLSALFSPSNNLSSRGHPL